MNRTTCAACVSAFLLTLCVLGLGLAFFTVECNLRQTVYGHSDPGIGFALEEGRPVVYDTATSQPLRNSSRERELAITALLGGNARVVWELWRRETALAARMWEWVT